jgi:hypothetical protein
VDDDWTPEALCEDDLSDSEDDADTIEASTEVAAGKTAFEWMISLTHIISEMLQKF